MGGVAKEYITKLGCEKYFSEGHILSTTGDALRCLSNTPMEMLLVAFQISPTCYLLKNLTQQ
jgi:hypothetical protein